MKDIYVIHTQFNSVYSEYLNNSELCIQQKEIEDEYGGTEVKEIGFGTTEPIAIIYFKDQVFVDFRCEEISKEQTDQLIIIVSDNMFYSDADVVLQRLKKIIDSTSCRLFPIYHQRETFKEFITTFEKEFENKISTPVKRYSHYKEEETEHWQDNPFYKLVELVNSTSEDEYDKALIDLKSFFPSDEEMHETNERKEKLKMLYSLLGANISEETKKSYQDLKTEYDDLPDLQPIIDGDFIRTVRDIILEKIV